MPIPYLITPWKHQRQAINIAAKRDSYGLFFEMGTGKTMTAINTIRAWSMKNKKLLNTLILCPPIVIDQWEEEFFKHSKIHRLQIIKLQGTGIKRAAKLKEALADSNPKIYITNYESMLMSKVYDQFVKFGLDVLICDESHKLKSIKAKRTKKIISLSDTIPRKMILTGSPILNTPMDIFSQYRILDGGKTFGKVFTIFRSRYFYDLNAGMPRHTHFPNWVTYPKAHEEIRDLITLSSMRVLKSECLDLPPLVKQKVFIPLSPEQAKAYKEMAEKFITYLGDKAAVATIALTKALRLQQITTGFVNLDIDESIHEFKDIPRLKALAELVEDLAPHNKIIIWASFHNNYKSIRALLDKMGVRYVELHGKCTEKQKKEAIRAFKTDKSIKIIIANQKAGGVGLNLTEASYAIYYSRTYSLEDDIQSEARNHRGGSEVHEKITRIDLISPGTIDEIILEALRKKINLADNILALKDQLCKDLQAGMVQA